MTEPAPLPHDSQSFRDRHVAMLSRLADAVMEIVTAIEGQAKAVNAGQAEPTPDALQAFALFPRVARALRLTLMLQDRLLNPPADAGGQRKDTLPGHQPITSIIRTFVSPDGPSEFPNQLERLTQEGREQLEREGIDRELLSRPTPELIAYIRQELNLAPDWLPNRLNCPDGYSRRRTEPGVPTAHDEETPVQPRAP